MKISALEMQLCGLWFAVKLPAADRENVSVNSRIDELSHQVHFVFSKAAYTVAVYVQAFVKHIFTH